MLHGDPVMARVAGEDRRGRREASIVEVLDRANTRVVGRLYEEHGIQFVVAENRRISQDILVAPGESGGAKAGQVVMLEILQQPVQTCAADRPRRRGAGQLCRSRHGDRDRAAQARSAQ